MKSLRNRSVILPLLGLAILLGGAVPARTEPVALAERIPVDVRRITLLVRDIDKSLPLYRDALGLKVIYDELIGATTDPAGKTTPPTTRLVLLRANDTFIGAIGLMQRLNVPAPPQKARTKPMAGEPILVINASDLESRFARIAAAPGVTVATAPERVDYPAPGGKGIIPVLFSGIYDPDGYFIEINKLLGAPAGALEQ